ncbi:MAG: flagellar hook-length control protein FliK [Treponema sp.]|nr:flagellar hook-length control protein FliK [Treponema sp.]
MNAIADIIVNNSSSDNLQLSQDFNSTLKAQSSQGSQSFEDLISFYQTEKTSEEVSAPEKTEKSETPDAEKAVEKTSQSENKAEVKEEKTEKSVKESSGEEVKSEKTEKTEKKSDKNKEKSPKNAKIKDSNEDKNQKQEIDYRNYNQIIEKSSQNKAENNSENKSEIKIKKTSSDIKNPELKEQDHEKDFSELLISGQSLSEIKEVKDSKSSFKESKNQNQKSIKEVKAKKLDKEGKITVEDLRTQKPEEIETEKNPKLKTSLKVTSENTATITMDYAQQNANSDILSLNNQSAASTNSTFQTMLNNQVQMQVPEFVKAGNIVLKDNNQGTINLVLHPDDLGNVKIQLSLDGKSLTGHISVASKEALEVFKDNSETLREAFIKSGFENASFDVSLGAGTNSNSNFDFEQQESSNRYLGNKMYSNFEVEQASDSSSNYEYVEKIGNYNVNIVA